jgi:glucose-6-phosphate isomerase
MQVEEGITSGDFLFGFFQGTRTALYDMGRESLTITVDTVDSRTIGALIALFERTVGLYAGLVNINAYHQPGVEAGKKAAGTVISLQKQIVALLGSRKSGMTVAEIAAGVGAPDNVEAVYAILRHLAANPDRGVTCSDCRGSLADIKFCIKEI